MKVKTAHFSVAAMSFQLSCWVYTILKLIITDDNIAQAVSGYNDIAQVIYLVLDLYTALTCEHLGAVGRFASLLLKPLLGFLAAPQIVRLLSNAKSAA